jgi:Tol biopolymer transport system component
MNRGLALAAAIVGAATALAAAGQAGGDSVRPRSTIVFTRGTLKPWTSHLYVVNPDGSGLRRLTNGQVADLYPSWSPDGSRIVFQRSVRPRAWDVYVVRADGSGLRRLTRTDSASEPAWSPDGRTIAYVTETGLFLMNADGTGRHLLTARIGGRYPVHSPAWSPDGRAIAYANRGGQIFVINADGTGERRVSRGLSLWCPAWSPDGRKLAFVVMPFDYDKIYTVDVASDAAERLVTRHAYTESGFAWTPDSSRIVYAREKHGGTYSIRVDGSGDRRLTRNALRQDLSAGGFSWSPDRRRIAYGSDVTGEGDIYLMNADGSGQRRLTSGPGIDGQPAWSLSPYTASC